MDIFEYDAAIDCEILCGVDEAGRGPLAGDVYAAAVILPKNCVIEGLNDSKKLSEKKRESLYNEIVEKALCYCVATASVEEIEEHNILQATFIAMKRAVEGLKITPKMVLIDGNKNPTMDIHTKCVVKGDSTSACIAAASILAKVERDRYMVEIDKAYPEYLFNKHKGYGTKLHYEMLDKYGQSKVHRTSFLKKYYAQKLGQSTVTPKRKIGNRGESLTETFLLENGYAVLEKNYICEHGEVDLICKKGDILAFVEVKTRKQNAIDDGKLAVGKTKQQKIKNCAAKYLQDTSFDLQPRFDVAIIKYLGDDMCIDYIENAFC